MLSVTAGRGGRVCPSSITRLHEITGEHLGGSVDGQQLGHAMITSNVINRTFRLRHGDVVGTCFTIDVEGRQYVVTARHVVADMLGGGMAVVEILHDGDWKPLMVQLAWLAEEPADVAILAPEQRLSNPYEALEPTPSGISIGQQVYFLGFTELAMLSPPGRVGFPMPLVRQGILAGILAQSGPTVLVIDGHNIAGFSGGPVVFKPEGGSKFRVAGVVSGYRPEPKRVFYQGKPTELYISENSGLVIAYGLQEGINHITANPTGAEIESGEADESD